MIDLLLPLEWILSGSLVWVLIKCLIICPGIPQLLGYLFESRWVPWSPKYQFLAFMPGNPFLAVFIAGCSRGLDQPGVDGFWQQRGVSQTVLVGAFVVYVALNIMDLASNYTREQMTSATKIYHNALYFWYAYLAVMAWIILLSSTMTVGDKILASVPGVIWLVCLVVDSAFTPKEVLDVRFRFAHTNNYPIWKNNWKLRRLTPAGYQ